MSSDVLKKILFPFLAFAGLAGCGGGVDDLPPSPPEQAGEQVRISVGAFKNQTPMNDVALSRPGGEKLKVVVQVAKDTLKKLPSGLSFALNDLKIGFGQNVCDIKTPVNSENFNPELIQALCDEPPVSPMDANQIASIEYGNKDYNPSVSTNYIENTYVKWISGTSFEREIQKTIVTQACVAAYLKGESLLRQNFFNAVKKDNPDKLYEGNPPFLPYLFAGFCSEVAESRPSTGSSLAQKFVADWMKAQDTKHPHVEVQVASPTNNDGFFTFNLCFGQCLAK